MQGMEIFKDSSDVFVEYSRCHATVFYGVYI